MAGKKESQLLFYSLWGTSGWFDSTGVIWWDINDGNQQQIQMELHFQLCVDVQVHDDDGGVDGYPAYSHPPYSHQVGIWHNE